MVRCFILLMAIVGALGCVNSSLQQQNEGPGGDTATIQGIKVLFLSGTHYERGYQHGNLLGHAVMDVFDEVLMQYMCKDRDSLGTSLEISTERSWVLLAGAGASRDCRYCLSFIPALGIIRYAVTTLDDPIPAYERPSGHYSMDLLFNHF